MSSAAHIDFHQLRVVVAHPRDSDGEVLIRHLRRLGCKVEHAWPAPGRLGTPADIVFCLLEPQTRELCSALGETSSGALIGVLPDVSDRSLQLLVEAIPQAVLTRPFHPAVILTNLLVARNNFRYQRRLLHKISKLDETLRSVRKVERAKVILMEKRRIGEFEAYAYLREQAMKKRLSIGNIAAVVVESHEVLSGDRD